MRGCQCLEHSLTQLRVLLERQLRGVGSARAVEVKRENFKSVRRTGCEVIVELDSMFCSRPVCFFGRYFRAVVRILTRNDLDQARLVRGDIESNSIIKHLWFARK